MLRLNSLPAVDSHELSGLVFINLLIPENQIIKNEINLSYTTCIVNH